MTFIVSINRNLKVKSSLKGVVHLLRNASQGRGWGLRFYDSSSKRNFSEWKICDKGGGV